MKRLLFPAAVAALVLVTACGGGSGEDTETSQSPTARASRTASASTSAQDTVMPSTVITEVPTAQPQAGTDVPQPQTQQPQPTAPPANSGPGWANPTNVTTETQYEYDDEGSLSGAVTTITIDAASDPDGDPLTYSWTATSGSISGNGTSAVWTRAIEFGSEASGDVTVTVSDGYGGVATYTIVF